MGIRFLGRNHLLWIGALCIDRIDYQILPGSFIPIGFYRWVGIFRKACYTRQKYHGLDGLGCVLLSDDKVFK